MKKFTIFHNPKCFKSRQTLELLKEKNITPEVIEYLKTPPSIEELTAIAQKLGLKPREFLRTKEKILEELVINFDDDSSVLKAMVEHPVLIERPIVVSGNRAALGRPPENILKLL